VGTVLTWNVAGRVRSVGDQARVLGEEPVDVLALQEVRASALVAWETALRNIGFEHIAATLPADGSLRPPDRRLGVLIASRAPLEVCPALDLPWPERHLAARTQLDGAPIEIHNLYAPLISKPDLVKVRTFETMHACLAAPSDVPIVLAGDLNTPQYESRDGEVQTFARTRSGRIRLAYGERHDAAELALLVGLQPHGYLDAFRTLHGYTRRDRSWFHGTNSAGFRIDHLIARGFKVLACEYVHHWREAGLSDHAAMWAELAPSTPSA
jgi:exonuclease III